MQGARAAEQGRHAALFLLRAKPRKSWKRLTPDSAANSARDTGVSGAESTRWSAFATQGDGALDVGRPIPCCRRMYTREQIRFSSLARQSECEAVRQANSRAKCPAKSGSRATGRTISTRPGISSSTSPATEGWVAIDHPPPARVAMQGRPVVHLARVHHDHVAGRGLDVSNPAP